MFQYTIWWTTWASTAVGSTMWRQSQHQRQSSYARRGNFNHLPTTTTCCDYKPTTSYYDAAIRPLPTTITTWTQWSHKHLRDYTSTTNHYAETSLREFTSSYYVSTTRSSVQFSSFINYDVPPMYQLTYLHSLLQLYRTIIWHFVPVLLFLSVMMSNSFYYS